MAKKGEFDGIGFDGQADHFFEGFNGYTAHSFVSEEILNGTQADETDQQKEELDPVPSERRF